MSHYTLTVALPGNITPDDLRNELEAAMARFDENREVDLHRDTSVYAQSFADQLGAARASNRNNWTEGLTDAETVEQWNGDQQFDTDGWPLTTTNPDGQWDWWVIGGRWGGAWALRGEDGPLRSEDHAFGRTDRADAEGRTDNARWRDIVPESVTPTYAWLDLAGKWRTRWVGPTREEAISTGPLGDTSHWTVPEDEHHAGFMKFLADLPGDTWLVHVDFHN